eukprot:m.158124 g.158124  ORF g.158124 m.158124 type:complete len:581 (+) comp24744_c0_seq2:3-1745(+)
MLRPQFPQLTTRRQFSRFLRLLRLSVLRQDAANEKSNNEDKTTPKLSEAESNNENKTTAKTSTSFVQWSISQMLAQYRKELSYLPPEPLPTGDKAPQKSAPLREQVLFEGANTTSENAKEDIENRGSKTEHEHSEGEPKEEDDQRPTSIPLTVTVHETEIPNEQFSPETQKQINVLNNLLHDALHLPQASAALREKARSHKINQLLQLNHAEVSSRVHKLLALLGCTSFANRKGSTGIRILAMDGGGTKGLVSIDVLKALERRIDRPLAEQFDLICGTSTGGILAFGLGVRQFSLDKLENMYFDLGAKVFTTSTVAGSTRVLSRRAYYDSNTVQDIFREHFGEDTLIDSASGGNLKMFVNSTLSEPGDSVAPYMFRNYNLPPEEKSFYNGTCRARVWHALRATTAAPGFFEPMILNERVHYDGGVCLNNPSILAIHEAKRIWGSSVPIELLVSVGTGEHKPLSVPPDKASWLQIATTIINSATEVHLAHNALCDLLPESAYFRFNPPIHPTPLSESRPEKLRAVQKEASDYLEQNTASIDRVADILKQTRSLVSIGQDMLRVKSPQLAGQVLSYTDPYAF